MFTECDAALATNYWQARSCFLFILITFWPCLIGSFLTFWWHQEILMVSILILWRISESYDFISSRCGPERKNDCTYYLAKSRCHSFHFWEVMEADMSGLNLGTELGDLISSRVSFTKPIFNFPHTMCSVKDYITYHDDDGKGDNIGMDVRKPQSVTGNRKDLLCLSPRTESHFCWCPFACHDPVQMWWRLKRQNGNIQLVLAIRRRQRER